MGDSVYDLDGGASDPLPPRPVVIYRPMPAPANDPPLGRNHILSLIFITIAAIITVANIGTVYYVTHRSPPIPIPAPAPAPETVISRATKDYVSTLPAAYGTAADQVASGAITDKQGIVESLQSHAQPLATAIDNEINPFIDAKGKVTDRARAATMLRSVQSSLIKGGK